VSPGIVLATLMHLRLWVGDASEDPADQARRLQDASVAISAASSSRELAAALLTLGEAETHFAAYVGNDRCHEKPAGMRCDRGKARSYWQLHSLACTDLSEVAAGDHETATLVAAQCAARLLRWGKYTCGSWAGAFNLYAGNACGKGPGKAREQRMRQVLNMLDHGGQPWPAEPIVRK
jgi:hypothetical protein